LPDSVVADQPIETRGVVSFLLSDLSRFRGFREVQRGTSLTPRVDHADVF
jgi:hypothetical protein